MTSLLSGMLSLEPVENKMLAKIYQIALKFGKRTGSTTDYFENIY